MCNKEIYGKKQITNKHMTRWQPQQWTDKCKSKYQICTIISLQDALLIRKRVKNFTLKCCGWNSKLV